MTKELREEIQQNQPFKSLEQEAYLSVKRTAALLGDHFDQVLAPFGVTSSQYNVLRILRGAEPNGLCRNDVRDRMLTRMPDMTRLLDRMEKAGLVQRTRSKDDRRQVSTRITDKGSRILDQLDHPVAEEHSRRLGHLTEAQLKDLIELLGQVRESS